jgi:uncharacterized lipoprotein YajG
MKGGLCCRRDSETLRVMKKLFASMALLALMGTVLLTGCAQEEAPPQTAPTNAPAQP